MIIAPELYKKKTAAATSTPRPPIRTLEIPSSDRKKEIISPPHDSPCDTRRVKGSPATLAKLMVKHKKKEKQLEKLKQQLKKTKEEEVELQKIVNALVALHCTDETGSYGSYSTFDEFSVDEYTTSRDISDIFNQAIFFLG